MSPLNGVNKELTGRVSLCAARAGGVMAAVSVCNYTLSRCILAAVVGEQAARRCARLGAGRREKSQPLPGSSPLPGGFDGRSSGGGVRALLLGNKGTVLRVPVLIARAAARCWDGDNLLDPSVGQPCSKPRGEAGFILTYPKTQGSGSAWGIPSAETPGCSVLVLPCSLLSWLRSDFIAGVIWGDWPDPALVPWAHLVLPRTSESLPWRCNPCRDNKLAPVALGGIKPPVFPWAEAERGRPPSPRGALHPLPCSSPVLWPGRDAASASQNSLRQQNLPVHSRVYHFMVISAWEGVGWWLLGPLGALLPWAGLFGTG